MNMKFGERIFRSFALTAGTFLDGITDQLNARSREFNKQTRLWIINKYSHVAIVNELYPFKLM